MNDTPLIERYLFIKLWAPQEEVADNASPFFVTRITKDNWGLSRVAKEAVIFHSADLADAAMRGVAEIKERIARGWGYEVVRITQEIVETNIDFTEEEEEEEEEAA